MAAKLSKPQRDVMNYLDKGWKAYMAGGNRVEINGRPVATTATMASLERLGLIEKLGVGAWTVTQAGREWRAGESAAKESKEI